MSANIQKTLAIPTLWAMTGTAKLTRKVPIQLAVRAIDCAAPTPFGSILRAATIQGRGPKPIEKDATKSRVAIAEETAHPKEMLIARVTEEIAIAIIDPRSKYLWFTLSNKKDAPRVTSRFTPEIPALRYFAALGRRSCKIETP